MNEVKIGWGRILCTVAVLFVLVAGARTGLGGFFIFVLPSIFVLVVLWTGKLAQMSAGKFAGMTTESWSQIEKADLRGIHQQMRQSEYAEATQQLEAILAKEPDHTEAMICAVNLYRLQDQIEKARQACLALLRRDDVAVPTIQALMGQIGMSPQEIQQACAIRIREDQKKTLLAALRQNPENREAAKKLSQLLDIEKAELASSLPAVSPPPFLQNTPSVQTPDPEAAPPAVAVCPSEDTEVRYLLAKNCIGSAVERLEAGLELFPSDFEGWMLLAHIQIMQCHSLNLADRTVGRVCRSAEFTPEQKAEAQKRLRDWKLRKTKMA